jgi:plasmid replication initiation protein
MSDFNVKNKVVQSNDFIQLSKWNLNAVPLKIFKTLISCIDTLHPPKDNMISISKGELFNMIGSESDGGYDYLKRKIKELQKTSITISEPNREIFVPLVNKIIWNKDDDNITCRFDEYLMPYLIDLQERFLQYDVASLKNFKSKYGVILYEYLLSMARQEQSQTEHPRYTYTIPMAEFRRLTDTENKLKDMKNFKRRVVEASVNDINQSCVEFLVKATSDGSRGKETTKWTFYLRKRTSVTETNYDIVARPEWIHRPI